MKRELRETERKILEILKEDGRASYSDIGNRVGVSRTAVKNAMTVMEQDGFISGYKVITNSFSKSNKVTFLISVQFLPQYFERAKEALKDAEETVSVMVLMADCRLLALCRTEEGKAKDFVGRLYNTEGVVAISTQGVLDVVKY